VRLLVDVPILDQVIGHLEKCLPNEGCGFLIGRGNVVSRFVPAANTRASPSAFEVDPQVLFDLNRSLRISGEDLVAICHSHPNQPACPSERDIREAHYPDSFYLIVSFLRKEPDVRVWRVVGAEALEAELHANI